MFAFHYLSEIMYFVLFFSDQSEEEGDEVLPTKRSVSYRDKDIASKSLEKRRKKKPHVEVRLYLSIANFSILLCFILT